MSRVPFVMVTLLLLVVLVAGLFAVDCSSSFFVLVVSCLESHS